MGSRKQEAETGFGDQLIGSGFARGMAGQGKKMAFGNGDRIIWDSRSEVIFRGNPNIAAPGLERDSRIVWKAFYKGHRIYNTQDKAGDRWVWNLDFHAQPGEMFFGPKEQRDAERFGKGFVLIEPNVERWKNSSANKDWGQERYQQVATLLIDAGYDVAQLRYDKSPPLEGVRQLATLNIRDALAILGHAALYIGPEGGLHHGAAAVGIPAVVLFGGFIPPSVTGYDGHANLTGGAEACGSLHVCRHCQDAMRAIPVDEVHAAALERL